MQPKQPHSRGWTLAIQHLWVTATLAAALACALVGPGARAQLAITEVMSWASTNCPGCLDSGPRGCHPDFWELTNFATNRIDLNGYLFVDANREFPGTQPPERIENVTIGPAESIIFLRTWPEVPD